MSLRKIGYIASISGLLLVTGQVQAQFLGEYGNSHYAGIYGVPGNPAAAAGTHFKWDVNIIGADARGGNTYASIPKSVLFNMPDTLRRDVDFFLDTAASRRQFGWGALDVLMPSVLYSIDERQAVAFTWRIRAAGNGGNITTDVANFFGINFPNPRFNGNHYAVDYGNVTGHWWNEFDFTYARVLKDDVLHRLKAGVTLKFLSGIAAGYAQVENASFTMHSRSDAEINSGTLKIGYSENIDQWESPYLRNYKLFANPGVGLDIGVIYEWRPDGDGFGSVGQDDSWNPEADNYKLRIGLSITDIGGIMYKKAPINADLDLRNESISPDSIKYRRSEGWQRYYRRVMRYFTPLESDDQFYMTTPMAVNMMGDYNVDGRFFVNASAVVALTAGKKDVSKTYAMTQLQVTPRYDTRHFGAYLPMALNRHGQFNAGIGLRAGPLVIGSASLLSNLFTKNIDRADGFIALRVVPIRLRRGEGGGGLFRKRSQLGCPANNF